MKMAKRIFIALLVIAVMASSFAFAASAASYTIEDYSNVLEYFEESTLICYDFTGEDVDYQSGLLLKNLGEVDAALVNSDEFGKYLSLCVKERSGWATAMDSHVYFGWTSDNGVDSFNLDMTVSGSVNPDAATEKNLPKIVVVVGGEKLEGLEGANNAGVTIASIDYRGGYFTYLKAVTDSEGNEYCGEYRTDFAIEADAWYNVSLTYDSENGNATITVTNCNEAYKTITVTDAYVPYNDVKDIRIGQHGDDNGTARGTEIKFASIQLLSGTYHRDPAEMNADVDAKILAMYELVCGNDATLDEKAAVADIVKDIVAYGYVSENEDVQNAMAALAKGAPGLYDDKIGECVNGFAGIPTYAEKRALVDECLVYAEFLENLDLTTVDEELAASILANVAALRELDAFLLNVESQTLAFIDAYATVKNTNIDNYPEAVAALSVLVPYANDVDSTYEGAGEGYSFYERLANSCDKIKTKSDSFIEAVAIASNTELYFNDRAVAFKSLKKLYYDNTTYPGVAEAIEIYNSIYDEMTATIEKADNFIKYVNKADYADYVTAKQENLELAAQYIDCHLDYSGVAEAQVLYRELLTYVTTQIDNAHAYINAVRLLEKLSGAELTAGIEKAKNLQAAGNVLGVEGVTEANIKLEQIVSAVELDTKYSEYFVRVVKSLDEANGAEAIYAILVEAKAAEAKANQRYEGVGEASEKLEKAINAYNKQVKAANDTFVKANETAAKTCGVGSSVKVIENRVIALVKKFFEEE